MWRIRVLGWLSVVLPPMAIVRVEAGEGRVSGDRGRQQGVGV